MDLEKFIVKPESKERESLCETWTLAISPSLQEKLMALPKEQRVYVHKSTRLFLDHLAEVFANESKSA
jgi:hypothetical protein